MISQTQSEIMTMVERWLRHELPLLNRSTEAHGDLQFFVARCQIRVDAMIYAARDICDERAASRLLQLLAFPVSSMERHLRMAGHASGEGVNALRVASALMRLGEMTGHPPRDSHVTYWLQDTAHAPLTFTGSTEESTLIRLMSEMHHLHSVSMAALRPILDGGLPVTSRMAADTIEFAADNEDRVTRLVRSFLAPVMDGNSTAASQFEVFAMTIATYLGDYPVGDQTYSGPDPANMPGPMEVDIAIGLAEQAERDAIRRRLPRLIPADRMRLETEMQLPSLVTRLAEAAELTENNLAVMSDRQLAEHIADRPWLHGALRAFAHLTTASDSRASYYAAMQQYLRPNRRSLSDTMSSMRTLEQPAGRYKTLPQTMLPRRSHPQLRRLVATAAI